MAAACSLLFLLQGCASSSSPQQQHEMGCLGNAVIGGLIGGTVGRQFGSGRGRDMATATGAAAGAAIRTQYRC